MSKAAKERISARPFLKWAGGKSKLIPQYDERKLLPPEFKTYYEPFLGGGAVFFYLWQTRPPFQAVLTDINEDLINTYQCVKDNVEDLIKSLKHHQIKHQENYLPTKERYKYYYYYIRDRSYEDPIERAARMIYLNRTCFNGLYRENSRGQFNVPMGKYTNPQICQAELLRSASEALKLAEIKKMDFEDVLQYAKTDDFVYFDPPYHPIDSTSYFTAYNSDGFSLNKQKRLKETFVQLANRRVKVMLSNSVCKEVEDLYNDVGFKHKILASRTINSNIGKRGKIEEFVITSYPINFC